MRCLPLFCTLILALSSSALASADLPFALRDGLLWVSVTPANGGAELNFVVDSGAGASVLDLEAARRLGLSLGKSETVRGVGGDAKAYRVQAPGMRLGSSALPSNWLALDLRHASGACHQRIDGLIGCDFLRSGIVQIDFSASVLRFSASRGRNGETVALKMKNGAPSLPLSVNGSRPRPVRLDTGFNGDLRWVSQSSKTAGQGSPVSIALASSGSANGAEIQIGNVRVGQVRAAIHRTEIFPGEAGLLGLGVLSRFSRVTIDLRGGQAQFEGLRR